MGVPGNANALLLRSAAAAGGYQVSRSLRFNGSVDNSYLSRTPASAGNRKTWTWSGWVKRTKIGSGINSSFFRAAASGQIWFKAGFQDDTISVSVVAGGAEGPKTSAVFRDTSAWYHIVIAFDTTQATAANRQKLYVNGVQVSFTTDLVWPNQNQDYQVNNTVIHYISDPAGGEYFDGYLADVWFVDGSALTPSDFAETDATTGQWIPKAYTGSKGTNGFHLEFADNASLTTSSNVGIGKDTSGNGNYWVSNNLSVTAGAGNDSLIDVPTNGSQTDTGVGGEVRGNYCTLNPLYNIGSAALTNGNLDYNSVTGGNSAAGTIAATTGKWYWEVTANTSGNQSWTVGVRNLATAAFVQYYAFDGRVYPADIAYGNTFTAGDVIGVALDMDNGKVFFSKNGTWQNSGNPSTGSNPAASSLSGPYTALVGHGSGASSSTSTANFGQRAFAYTAPSGYKALCTANLPAPSVTKPSTVFDVKTYVGNGDGSDTTKSTGPTLTTSFSPDFVWIKCRNVDKSHALHDIIRGERKRLYSNLTNSEYTYDHDKLAFNSTGIQITTNDNNYNNNNDTYVSWMWDAGSSTVTNTAGSITSSVRANPTAGFSIVTYSGTGTTGTVGHGGLVGLDKGMIIVKTRTGASVANWMVYHGALGATKVLEGLNTTSAATTDSSSWNNTAPTSTVFTVGGSQANVNGSGRTFVAYCFAPVVGYSSFGSYTGNGSSDGPFVFTGMRPRWILFKKSSGTENWRLHDTERSTYNAAQSLLFPNLSNAETTSSEYAVDILSNGFKIRTNVAGSLNDSGATYVYAAFAESPVNYSRAR